MADMHDTQVVDLLFEAYFQDGANLSDINVLTRAAVDAGMEAAEVSEYLQSNRNVEEIEKAVATTKKLAPGVPFFVFNQRFSLSLSLSLSDQKMRISSH